MAAQTIGENVEVTVEGEVAVIKIKLSHRGEVSSSGKTRRVASTLATSQSLGPAYAGPECLCEGLT